MYASNVYTFPLTGAQAIEHNTALVTAGGFEHDREFVAYDVTTPHDTAGFLTYTRVSQKQVRALAQIVPTMLGSQLSLEHGASGALCVPATSPDDRLVMVDEFEDPTPAYDMGDEAADYLRAATGERVLRLAQKASFWQDGGCIPPERRRNAPVHITTAASVRAAEHMQGNTFGASRFRPNIVVGGTDIEPFAEVSWVGKRLRIGNELFRVTRQTERCIVPGNHQTSGEKMNDVFRAYKQFPRISKGGKPTFGVYAYPEMSVGDVGSVVVGQEVELLDDLAA
jgi:uncharacterized protein YcbX